MSNNPTPTAALRSSLTRHRSRFRRLLIKLCVKLLNAIFIFLYIKKAVITYFSMLSFLPLTLLPVLLGSPVMTSHALGGWHLSVRWPTNAPPFRLFHSQVSVCSLSGIFLCGLPSNEMIHSRQGDGNVGEQSNPGMGLLFFVLSRAQPHHLHRIQES